MENYMIRSIKPQDYHDIHELNVKAGYEYEEEKVKARIQNLIDTAIDIVMVAELDGKVIGYIHGTPYNTLYSDKLMSIVQFVFTKEHREDKRLISDIIAKFEADVKRNGYTGLRMAADADRKVLYEIMMNNQFENKRDLKHYIKYF